MSASEAAVQQTLAAWIQAVGSIVGIAITVFIFWRQSRNLRIQANAAKLALLDGVLAILQDIELCVSEVARQWDAARDPRPAHFAGDKARLLQALVALNQLPLHEIQPYRAMSAFLSAKQLVSECVERLDRAVGPVEVNGVRINDFTDWASVLAEYRNVIQLEAKALRQ